MKKKEILKREVFNHYMKMCEKLELPAPTSLPDDMLEELDKSFDVKSKSNHNLVTRGVDMEQFAADMRDLKYETARMIIFDSNDTLKKVVNYTTNQVTAVGDYNELRRRSIPFIDWGDRVISVHNHPYSLAMIPSWSDDYMAICNRMMCSLFGAVYLDDCIIGEEDFYSRWQDQETNPKRVKVLGPFLSQEAIAMLRKENRPLEYFIRTAALL